MSERTYGGLTGDEIRALADEATPGRRSPRWGGEPGYITIAGQPIGEIYAAKTDARRNPDLDLICATDPATVLALLDHITHLEWRNARLRAALGEMVTHVGTLEYWHGSDLLDAATDRARAALEETTGEHTTV